MAITSNTYFGNAAVATATGAPIDIGSARRVWRNFNYALSNQIFVIASGNGVVRDYKGTRTIGLRMQNDAAETHVAAGWVALPYPLNRLTLKYWGTSGGTGTIYLYAGDRNYTEDRAALMAGASGTHTDTTSPPSIPLSSALTDIKTITLTDFVLAPDRMMYWTIRHKNNTMYGWTIYADYTGSD